MIGVPWPRSSGSEAAALSTVAVSVTPGCRDLSDGGHAGGGAGVDDLGDGGVDGAAARRRRCRPPRSTAMRSGRTANSAGAADERLGGVTVEHVGGADEVGDEPVDRVLVDVARLADLLDAAVVEDREPVAQRQGLVLVVGDDDEGDADLALNRLELHLHLLAQLEVERAERLVEQQDLRAADQGAGQGDALALAARELRGLARSVVGEPDHVERLGGAACVARPSARRGPSCRTRRSAPTVMWGKSAYSWNTVLTSRRRAGSAVTSTPPSRMVPAVGCSKPAIIRSTVVLPDPDGPRIANSSPSSTVEVGARRPRRRRAAFAEHLANAREFDLRFAGAGWHGLNRMDPSRAAAAQRMDFVVIVGDAPTVSVVSPPLPALQDA